MKVTTTMLLILKDRHFATIGKIGKFHDLAENKGNKPFRYG